MATRTRMFSFVLLMMSFTVLMGSCCSAKSYKVGDSEGWIAKADTYTDWAWSKEFHVGDSLIFEYDRNVNDVTQVSGALEYGFCNSPSPKAVYNTGQDVVTLTEPGYHYFISSNHTRCLAGQRVIVFVVHDLPRAHQTPPPAPRKMLPSRHQIPPPAPRKILPSENIYKVGDSKEWRVPEESDFYQKWSEERQFHVGDSLLFYYNDQVDDVIEVSGDLEFNSCDPTSPIAVHNSGIVKLTKPGVNYFITSRIGHCEAGLKLRVVVLPLPKPVPTKMHMSPLDRLNKWLQTIRRQPRGPHH